MADTVAVLYILMMVFEGHEIPYDGFPTAEACYSAAASTVDEVTRATKPGVALKCVTFKREGDTVMPQPVDSP